MLVFTIVLPQHSRAEREQANAIPLLMLCRYLQFRNISARYLLGYRPFRALYRYFT